MNPFLNGREYPDPTPVICLGGPCHGAIVQRQRMSHVFVTSHIDPISGTRYEKGRTVPVQFTTLDYVQERIKYRWGSLELTGSCYITARYKAAHSKRAILAAIVAAVVDGED